MPSAREITPSAENNCLCFPKSSERQPRGGAVNALNVGEAVGYAGPVPIIHKEAALVAMIAEFESGLGVSDTDLF